jgi:hypothetical protein
MTHTDKMTLLGAAMWSSVVVILLILWWTA